MCDDLDLADITDDLDLADIRSEIVPWLMKSISALVHRLFMQGNDPIR